MTIFIFILILVALILVHEFGHFIAAKAFKIRVDEFGIFFPPRLLSFKWGETVYSLNALPFGGFVRIFGENGPESASDEGGAPQDDGPRTEKIPSKESSYPTPAASAARSFISKPRWQQATVIVAGIVFNLIFAWLILSAGYMYGIPTAADHEGVGQVRDAHATIMAVLPESPADKAGLKAGDTIVSVITGSSQLPEASNATEVQQFIAAHQDESLGFTVDRNGTEVQAIAKPVEGLAADKKVVGIELGDVGILQLPVHMAFVQGALLGKEITIATAQGLIGFFSQVFRGQADFSEVSGPVGIVSMGGTAVQQGFIATVLLTALISINLAILNLLPIPGLDGGRLLFIAIEAVTRRPISQRVALTFTLVGLGLLVLLMVVVSYHDIVNLIHPVA